MAQTSDSLGTDAKRSTADEAAASAIKSVTEAIGRLRYGAIGLTVHDGRVVQLEVTERQRFS